AGLKLEAAAEKKEQVVALHVGNGYDSVQVGSGHLLSLRLTPNGLDAQVAQAGPLAAIARHNDIIAAILPDGRLIRSSSSFKISAPEPFLRAPFERFRMAYVDGQWIAVAFDAKGPVRVNPASEAKLFTGMTDVVTSGTITAGRLHTGGWKFFDAGNAALDAAACEEQTKDCFALVLTDKYGFAIKAASVIIEEKQAKAADAMAAIPELKALHEQFVKLQAERVTAPFEAEVSKLNAGYVGGIDREIASEKKAGHLDGVIALEAEKQRVTGARTPSSAVVEGEDAGEGTRAPALTKLRDIYRAAYAKIDAARSVNLKALTDPLTLRLKQLESTLTQQNRVPDAKIVREYREKLAEGSAGTPARNVTQSVAATQTNVPDTSAGSPPSTSSQPKIPKPKDAFNEREAAEWVLSFAGKGEASVTVLVPGKSEQRIQSLAQLPKEKFLVRKLAAQPSLETDRDLITDQDAVRLMGLEDVREIRLAYGRLTSLALRALAQMPTLEVLNFQGAHLTAADLAVLENAPIKSLHLAGFSLKDEAAMRVFSTMKNLRTLSLGDLINSEVIAAMPVLPKLEIFTSATNDRVLDDLLPLLPKKFPALQRIDLWQAKKIQGETLGSLKDLKDLRDLGLNHTQVDDNKLTAITGMKQLQILGISGTKVTDACIPTLKTLKALDYLSMFETQITDAGLLELAEIRSLRRLYLKHTVSPPIGPPSTGFTEAGVDAFQKKRPDVTVTR
ncbi:MAG: hypothetical protein Q8M07_23745, partial [Prosthecobacter sp.]|nr:hypothetical protein [Prosthecobacter sp.]